MALPDRRSWLVIVVGLSVMAGGIVRSAKPGRPTPHVALFAGPASGVEDDMGWLGIGVALAIVVGIVVMIARRPTRDLGAVSTNWLSQHRDAL
jgi:hypothetical protein